MIAERIPQLSELSTDEKMVLMAELWEEIKAQEIPLESPPPKLIEALDELVRFNETRPTSTWDEVRARTRRNAG